VENAFEKSRAKNPSKRRIENLRLKKDSRDVDKFLFLHLNRIQDDTGQATPAGAPNGRNPQPLQPLQNVVKEI